MTNTRLFVAAPIAALILLGGCNSEPIQVGQASDPHANELKNAPPVQLPPSIKEAKSYRCRDNSVVHITYLSDDTTAVIRSEAGAEPPLATLTAPAAGQPFVSEGYSLTGNGATVTYKSPQRAAQSCRR